jgi:Nif-specific regulatory protein
LAVAVTSPPDLSQLHRQLGDLVVEEEISRTSQAVLLRVRTGPGAGGDRPQRALKIALTPVDGEELARFHHEVRLLSEASHPNVVRVFDSGVLPGGFPWLLMELVSSESLAGRLAGPLDGRGSGWELFHEAALQAAAGLAHIHRQGVVHMDLKPANIGLALPAAKPGGLALPAVMPGGSALPQVAPDGADGLHLKILDFGLAQPAGGPLDRRIRGTLAYTAPEVLLQDGYDHRADLYSLGMTLFELATGVLPSAGGDLAALRFHLEGEVPDPRALRPDLPPALAAILQRLLARDPAARFPSAGRLLAALAQAPISKTGLQAVPDPAEPASLDREAEPAVSDRSDHSERSDTASPAGRAAPLLASRLIGRAAALERLRAALGAAAAGRGGALLVEGEEGVGKSRLLRELRLHAALGGARVGRGAGNERGAAADGPPLAPFLAALAELGIDLRSRLAAPSAPAAPSATDGGADPRGRFRLYGEVAAALAAEAAAGSPLVLLLDDLHLAGPASAELLADLAEELGTVAVLVVATARPGAAAIAAPARPGTVATAAPGRPGAGRPDVGDPGDPDPAEAGEAGEALARLRLAPLERADTAALVDACLGTAGLPPSFYTWVFQQSHGVPAAVQQQLHLLVDRGVLQLRDGDWKPSLAALARWPATDGDAVGLERQILAQLPAAGRELLEAAAVAGGPLPLELLAALAGGEAQTVYAGLSALVAQGLLARFEEPEGARYELARRSLRQALEESLAGRPERQQQLHRALGRALEEQLARTDGRGPAGPAPAAPAAPATPASRPELVAAVAEHLWRGGERVRSLPYQLQAAAAARAVYGFSQAAGFFGRAAEAAGEAGDAVAAAEARFAEAEALAAAGSYQRALRALGELLGRGRLAPLTPLTTPLATRCHLLEARLHSRLGEHEAALASAEEGLARLASPAVQLPAGPAADRQRDRERAIELLHAKALALRDLGELEEAFATARAALAEAARPRQPRLLAALFNTLGTIFSGRGDWRRARHLIRRGLQEAERAGDGVLCGTLRNNLGNVCWKTGDFDGALALYSRNLEVSERTHDLWGQVFALNNLAILEGSRGNWKAARGPLTRSLDLKRRLGARDNEALARLNLGEVEEVLGNWGRAERHYLRALKLLEESPDDPERFAALAQLASLARKRGRGEEAARWAGEALAGAERVGDRDLLAHCHLQLGLIARDTGLTGSLVAPDAAGALGESAEHLHRALALLEESGARQAAARVQTVLADLVLRREGAAPATAAQVAVDVDPRLAQLDQIAQLIESARQAFDEVGDRFGRGRLLAVEARLAEARGEPRQAEELFAAGVRLLGELETPYEQARTLLEWGLATASPVLARERLSQALALSRRLGAAGEEARAADALERLERAETVEWGGQSPRGGRPAGDAGGAAGGGESLGAVLSEVSKVINSTLDLDEVLNRAMDLVIERLGAERGLIVLADPLTRELQLTVARNLGAAGRGPERAGAGPDGDGPRDGDGPSAVDDQARRLSESVVRRVIESGEPVLAADALTDRRFAGAESIIARHILSILCVPLFIRGQRAPRDNSRERPAGAIYVDHSRSAHLFNDGDLRFLVSFADQAAIAIDNARLYGELDTARQRLKEENESLRREILSSHHLGALIGRSRAIAELKQTLERVAQSPSTVLIRGESGTGKGLVARLVHNVSPRRAGPFIQFNCAALPETLVESELFGHEKGAFTGAANLKPGRFELAHNGTIFVDEIGKVSRSVQSKLLRVVEEKEFERVGGTRTLRADVRIITATNLDLERAVAEEEFREDLYYRLNIIPILLPPLRDRREDIPYLVQHFLGKITRDLGLPPRRLDPSVLELFHAHDWPGNIRELEAAVHRALVLSTDDELTVEDFAWITLLVEARTGKPSSPSPASAGGTAQPQPAAPLAGPGIPIAEGTYETALESYDRQLIAAALAQSQGRIRETARLLGIARNTLKAKMKKYGLEAEG